MGFYFVTTGWILEIGLCVNSIKKKSINIPGKREFSGSIPVGSDKGQQNQWQKPRWETDNAIDTQYLIVRATLANQLLRANQYELACFGLPSPWSFPPRSGMFLHAVMLLLSRGSSYPVVTVNWILPSSSVLSLSHSGSPCRDPFRHETLHDEVDRDRES